MESTKFPDDFKILGQYLYNESLMLGEYCTPESVQKFKQTELRNDDVIIASYPKSGTTFLQEVVWLLRHQADVEAANMTYTNVRTPFLEDNAHDNYSVFKTLKPPRQLKTHLPFSFLPNAGKIIYIYRNPRDVLVSFYYFYKATKQFCFFPGNFDQFFDLFHRVNKGLLYYGNMFDHIGSYIQNKNQENLLILSYEDMVRNHRNVVCKIADFLQVELTENQVNKIVEATKFNVMCENPKTNFSHVPQEIDTKISKFMRKGKIGDWKNYFNEDQIEIMNEMEKIRIGDLDITFVYE